MTRGIFILLCLTLAACATPEQRAMQKAAQDQADVNSCLSYGFKPDSEGFSNCRLQLELIRQERYYSRPVYVPHSHFNYNHWY